MSLLITNIKEKSTLKCLIKGNNRSLLQSCQKSSISLSLCSSPFPNHSLVVATRPLTIFARIPYPEFRHSMPCTYIIYSARIYTVNKLNATISLYGILGSVWIIIETWAPSIHKTILYSIMIEPPRWHDEYRSVPRTLNKQTLFWGDPPFERGRYPRSAHLQYYIEKLLYL